MSQMFCTLATRVSMCRQESTFCKQEKKRGRFVQMADRKSPRLKEKWVRDGRRKSAKKEIKQGVSHLQMFAEKREIFVTGLSLVKIRETANFA